MQGFTVPVAQLLGHPGEYRDLEVSGPLQGVGNSLARLNGEDVVASVRLESIVEGILVTGAVAAPARIECSRCLKESLVELDAQVTELYATPGHIETAGEDAYLIEGRNIDLEPLIRDAVGLSLPLNPVCEEDCRGLCTTCGKDLNTGPCGCKEDDFDPRWAALADLREKLSAES